MGGHPRKMDRATLTMAMAAMSDLKAKAVEIAGRLGLATTTLYAYVNGDGSPKGGWHCCARRHKRARQIASSILTAASYPLCYSLGDIPHLP